MASGSFVSQTRVSIKYTSSRGQDKYLDSVWLGNSEPKNAFQNPKCHFTTTPHSVFTIAHFKTRKRNRLTIQCKEINSLNIHRMKHNAGSKGIQKLKKKC